MPLSEIFMEAQCYMEINARMLLVLAGLIALAYFVVRGNAEKTDEFTDFDDSHLHMGDYGLFKGPVLRTVSARTDPLPESQVKPKRLTPPPIEDLEMLQGPPVPVYDAIQTFEEPAPEDEVPNEEGFEDGVSDEVYAPI